MSSRRLEQVFRVKFFVFQVFSRSFFKMSSRHLQDVFARSLPKTSSRRLRKTSKTSLKHLRKTSSPDIFATRLPKTSSRRFQDFCKTPSRRVSNTSSRRLQEDLLQLGLEDVLGDIKCYTEDVFSTSPPRQMFAGNIRLILSFSTK